jgi:hypothetical protein
MRRGCGGWLRFGRRAEGCVEIRVEQDVGHG